MKGIETVSEGIYKRTVTLQGKKERVIMESFPFRPTKSAMPSP